MHNCRYGQLNPQTRKIFRQSKLTGNKIRDKKNLKKLKDMGWKVLIVWECQIHNVKKLSAKLANFLKS